MAPELIDQEIEVRFDPFDLSLVYVFSDGKLLLKAFPLDLKRKRYPKLPPKQSPAKIGPEISYLDILLEKYQKMIQNNMEKFSFKKLAEVETANHHHHKKFLEVVEKKFDRKLKLIEKESLKHLFDQYGDACLKTISGMESVPRSPAIIVFSKFLETLRRKIVRQKQEE